MPFCTLLSLENHVPVHAECGYKLARSNHIMMDLLSSSVTTQTRILVHKLFGVDCFHVFFMSVIHNEYTCQRFVRMCPQVQHLFVIYTTMT